MNRLKKIVSHSPDETFALGAAFGETLKGGEAALLEGGLGAGKTLFTKGILSGAGYDPDEVTSPSFALVNLYRTNRFDVYHIDLWRIPESADAAFEVGLNEILDESYNVVIVEWPEKLRSAELPRTTFHIRIEGDGDEPRSITISQEDEQLRVPE
ncbi:MAG: tRNA (adenosine(37)-N6)-threonylcarbamoyltransferase complex ATPase subunit type 1 TsaE [Acidobacteriota bacterium]